MPGVIACTGPYAWRFSSPLTIVSRSLNAESGSRILPSWHGTAGIAGVHSLMIAPCGKYTNAMRGIGLAAVAASAVRAGTMASKSGSAMVAPMPRRKVRRFRCFFEMNIVTPATVQSPPVAALSGSAPPDAKRTSCVVMNSSSTGLPSLVARMPFTIAWTTCSGSVTRSP